jgi:hypothetical protein
MSFLKELASYESTDPGTSKVDTDALIDCLQGLVDTHRKLNEEKEAAQYEQRIEKLKTPQGND